MNPTPQRRTLREIIGAAAIAALIVFALVFGARHGQRSPSHVTTSSSGSSELSGPVARFEMLPAVARLAVTSADARSHADFDLSLVIDGRERPLIMRRSDLRLRDPRSISASFTVEAGDDRATALLELRLSESGDTLTVSLTLTPEPGSSSVHSYALRVGSMLSAKAGFVPTRGMLSDVGATEAQSVLVASSTHPIVVVSPQIPIHISQLAPDVDHGGSAPRVVITTPAETTPRRPQSAPPPKSVKFALNVLVSASEQRVWGQLYRLLATPVAKVTGIVTAARDAAVVVGSNDRGAPLIRTATGSDGRFEIDAPVTAVQWVAALESASASTPMHFTPGSANELRLDVAPGGEVRIRVTDGDTRLPLVARLMIRGIDGTRDPSFGPDYRATGAGPLIDVLKGETVTPLAPGRYRVSATKGLEWTIDAQTLEVQSGRAAAVNLELRHVVTTPGIVGCDLHVHARPSFDSPVTPEDRVLSLVSAGVDFAVPTEHNIVGDYTNAADSLGLGKQLAHVTGVEVTTYNPRFGHFGLFPYPASRPVPPFRGANAASLFSAAKRGDASRVLQVNHPRLPSGIGYFNVFGFDPKTGRLPSSMRADFDALEVYNGYDLGTRGRTEAVIEDWFALLNLGKRYAATGSSDSHRIQYQWAGYPRTMALVTAEASGDSGGSIDTAAVVRAIKNAHSFVTSGPIVDVELSAGQAKARPGDDLPAPAGTAISARVRIRAAPWVDVTSLDIVAGIPPQASSMPRLPWNLQRTPIGKTETVYRTTVTSRPTRLGREQGTLDDAAARTVRLETDVTLKLPDGATWVVVMVRGDRPLDDALAFMPIQPLAFTNPIWIAR